MNSIIFLDIDGVINPFRPKMFPIKEPFLKERLAKENNNPNIEQLDLNLVTQVYHGFDKEACVHIQKLCKEFDAKIVVTSSWRLMYSVSQLQAILDIHHLGKYVIDKTGDYNTRASEIIRYCQYHFISTYIVIDDFNMPIFGSQMIHTKKSFKLKDYIKARNQLLLLTKRKRSI